MRHTALLILLLLFVSGCERPSAEGHDEKHDDHAEHGEHSEHEDHDDHSDHDDPKVDDHEGHDHEEPKDLGEPKGHVDGEEPEVHLSPEALKRSNIQVRTVTTGVLAGALQLPAEVQLNPDRVAHISPLVEGQLLSVDVTLGDQVEPKQKLARLRSVELGQARAELSRTTSLRKVADQTWKRQKQLRSEGISSERTLLEAELAYQQADAERDAALSRLRVFNVDGSSGSDMTLKSPIAGIIMERHATRGENVSPSDTLFIVADLSRVWIIGRVYEQQVAQVTTGMIATLSLNAYPARTWSGTVDFVGAALDESTRTLPIRVEVDNPDGLLRPGLFGSLRLASGQPSGDSVLVPLSAIQTIDNKTVVFVPGKGEGEFIAHRVTVGRQGQRETEVIEGLRPDSKVVVQGAFVLKSEVIRGELGHGHAH